MRERWIRWIPMIPLLLLPLLWPESASAESGEKGMGAGDLMRNVGLLVALAAFVELFLVEFVFRERLERSTYHWLMFMGLFLLPFVAILGATTTVFEETKTVNSCNTCHNMEPFVEDMQNPHSASLAARHYQNRWIPEKQCYQCHTTYGIHGTLEGKRDGFRHWLLYVTDSWEEPIEYSGSYPNVNCLECHAGTPKFERVESHHALLPTLTADEVSCTACHGPPHPTPNERPTTREEP
jgi:cytochrome c nitrite reductase small subunit